MRWSHGRHVYSAGSKQRCKCSKAASFLFSSNPVDPHFFSPVGCRYVSKEASRRLNLTRESL